MQLKMNYEVEKKPNLLTPENSIKITNPAIVFDLKEIQEIKNAIQEHLLYIGLDNGNHVRNVSILSIGNSDKLKLDPKHIVRKALVNANDRVILVHNHPSNSLEASSSDKKFTNTVQSLLSMFNIELLDHVIVTENAYTSMKSKGKIIDNYQKYNIDLADYQSLLSENKELKEKVKTLENRLNRISKNRVSDKINRKMEL